MRVNYAIVFVSDMRRSAGYSCPAMRSCLLIAAMLQLAGCSLFTGISSRYPRGWPGVVQHAGCPDLAGRYENEGKSSYGSNEQLAQRLGDVVADFVELQAAQNQLIVDARSASGASHRLTLSAVAGDFTCENGALILKPIVESAGDGTGGYRAQRRLALWRASNGDLIGEDRFFSVGALLWVVPVAGSQTYWYRWLSQPK